MPARRYEVRVSGRLSQRLKDAFPDMVVVEAPAETVIGSTVGDATQLSRVLSLIDSLGLHVVAIDQVPPDQVPPGQVLPVPRHAPDAE
jgi:hypothetical protein